MTAVSLYLPAADVAAAKRDARDWPSWPLPEAQLGRLELLLSGAFSPLRGYPDAAQRTAVAAHSRLVDGTPWPLMLTLPVSAEFARELPADGGARVALRDPEGALIALLTVDEVRPCDGDDAPDGGRRLCLAGPVQGVDAPRYFDFPELRLTPQTLAAGLPACAGTARLGWPLTTPPGPAALAAAERRRATLAAGGDDALLLLAACVGTPAVDDRGHYARVRLYRAAGEAGGDTSRLLLLPLPDAPDPDAAANTNTNMNVHASTATAADAGDWLLRLIVLQNYGCSHALVPERWREALTPLLDALTITPVFWQPPAAGDDRPAGYARERPLLTPTPAERGLTVFFTGLSGSGKSTIANALLAQLLAASRRSVTLLDGDRVRHHLSSELGFSKHDRNINIERIGYVASEISKHGGIAICAPIAPYAATRRAVRAMVERDGGFFEVHVATPLEVCERRDRKGLYAKARAGLIGEFTGISDPYEEPQNPEMRIDTTTCSAADAARQVLTRLAELGYLDDSSGLTRLSDGRSS